MKLRKHYILNKIIFSWIVLPSLIISLIIYYLLIPPMNPKSILIYTQKSNYPNIVLKISSLPLAFASLLKFKSKSFAALPSTRLNIEWSLKNAKFLIIGTHGRNGGLITDDGGWIGPDNQINNKLKLAYFGTCYFGDKRSKWQLKFPKAKLIGYDKLTYPWDGWQYLALQSWIDLLKIDYR